MDVLLVFAKVPVPGHVKTRLIPRLGAEGASRLYAAMLADSLADFATLGVDVRLCIVPSDEPMPPGLLEAGVRVQSQRGDTLAERLEAAFEDAFAEGAARVVVVGTDHPTLPRAIVADAFSHLDAPDVLTLSPADDGGFVLLGLARPAPDLFEGMAYSHDGVLDETLRRADVLGLRVVRLPAWYDVDEPADLHRLAADLAADPGRAPRTRDVLASLLRPDAA